MSQSFINKSESFEVTYLWPVTTHTLSDPNAWQKIQETETV